MGKIIGMGLVLAGIAGMLYSWVTMQKQRVRRMEICIAFLQKTIFAMKEENIKIIRYLESYESRESVLDATLQEVASRLRQNVYPDAVLVWQEVMHEKKDVWNVNDDVFEVLLEIGQGLFGRTLEQNICFLEKSLKRLEKLNGHVRETDAKERKVWIPVGMLGGIMLILIFI